MTVRPSILLAVVGVGTGVGKTWTTIQIVTELRRRGLTVAVRKPVQSFAAHELGSTDAELLAVSTGQTPHVVCPPHRWYGEPMAPPMAADVLGLAAITSRELVEETVWPPGVDIGIVETVGGVRSPMTHDTDSIEFARLLQPDGTLLVADAGLGAINAIRLAAPTLAGLAWLAFLNRHDHSELHHRNQRWLQTQTNIETATTTAELCQWLRQLVPSEKPG